MKTLEEYILNELQEAKDKIVALEQENASLKEAMATPAYEEEEEKKWIYFDDTPQYYYAVNVSSAYDWNDFLKIGHQTPDLIKEALTNDNALDRLCNLKRNDYTYFASVSTHKYDYLFKCWNKKSYVVDISDYNTSFYCLDGKYYFLDKDEATQACHQKVRNEIAYYLQHYAAKFKNN